ncbi:MAG: tetratricopeptide repeat protein [Sphingomonas bacterium]|nr:tetratricopeptide repeat protein [Sphingomonas bacterium]MDB5689716.1 tetratricopeptide repeat protein [Sphingomonas bacterium]
MQRAFAYLTFLAGVAALGGAAWADGRSDSLAATGRARAALAAGDPRAARVELLNAIKADPANGTAHLLQGQVYLRLGDGPAAEAEIARARETGIDPGTTRHLMAEALLLQGAARRALDEAGAATVAPAFAGSAARQRGRAQARLGDVSAAAAEFALAVRLSPRDAGVWADLGRFRATSGDAAGALQATNRAIALAPANLEAVILKGELARTQYGLVASLPWFDRALEIDPQSVPAMLEKAATVGEIGRNRDMLAVTRAVLAVDPENPVAFYLQAVMAARAGDFVLARSLVGRTRGAMDDLPAMLLLAGAIDLHDGNGEQAIGRLARLVELQPGNLKARRMLAAAQFRTGDHAAVIATLRDTADSGHADTYVLTLIGRAMEARGDRAAAARYLDRAAMPLPAAAGGGVSRDRLEMLRRAVSLDPGSRDARAALARALLDGGALDAGLAEARVVLAANPDDPFGLVLAGDAFAARGSWGDAAEAYRRAANVSFTEPVALRLIDALRRVGNAPAAYQALGLFLAQTPRSVPGLLLAADLAIASGQWDRVIDILEGVRQRLGNRDAALLNNLAWAYAQTGERPRAVVLARAAHALVPANPAAADTYGWMLVSSGRQVRRGVTLLEQAAAQAPAAPAVRWHLAQGYAAVGRSAAARAEARAALSLPGFVDRRRAEALLAGR